MDDHTSNFFGGETIESIPCNEPDWNEIKSDFKIIASATQSNAVALKALKEGLLDNPKPV